MFFVGVNNRAFSSILYLAPFRLPPELEIADLEGASAS